MLLFLSHGLPTGSYSRSTSDATVRCGRREVELDAGGGCGAADRRRYTAYRPSGSALAGSLNQTGVALPTSRVWLLTARSFS